MDIKSAHKAHLAEHKIDERLLTTRYYEPTLLLNGDTPHISSTCLVPKEEKLNGAVPSSVNSNRLEKLQNAARYTSTSSTSHG